MGEIQSQITFLFNRWNNNPVTNKVRWNNNPDVYVPNKGRWIFGDFFTISEIYLFTF
jgi:hypothetical protein